jgi:hypothetical protein
LLRAVVVRFFSPPFSVRFVLFRFFLSVVLLLVLSLIPPSHYPAVAVTIADSASASLREESSSGENQQTAANFFFFTSQKSGLCTRAPVFGRFRPFAAAVDATIVELVRFNLSSYVT